MLTKIDILQKLDSLKSDYQKEGIELYALFGSYAKDRFDDFSDIDIAYKIDYEKFSKRYRDGFSKLLRLQNVKKELEKTFNKKVDFVPFKESFKESIYV
jgi:predicted nucleotidyltransferase